MPKLTAKAQRELLSNGGVHNPHDLCRKFNPAAAKVVVNYTPSAMMSAKWMAYGINFKTDPGGWWGDHGNKAFNVFGRNRKETVRLEAIAWATEQGYGTEWVKDPFGAYQTAETIASLNVWLEEARTLTESEGDSR